MSVDDYQKMMDRGWRRCGTYYYKYDFEKSCCQPFTIRLDTTEYAISKGQKKVMKRFNKYLIGEIDMEGKPIEEEEKKQPMLVDQSQNEDSKVIRLTIQRSIIEHTLKTICKDILKLDSIPESKLTELASTSIISNSKDKQLKDTKSWSANTLILLFFKLVKPTGTFKNIKEVVDLLRIQDTQMKDLLKILTDYSDIKVEDSGYITFLNIEKEEESQKEQPKKIQKKEKEEEKKKGELINDDLNYTQYFKEFAPLKEEQKKKGIKHRYTVQITRSISDQESFDVYAKYQEKVHNEPEKSIQAYARFLCDCPLFDPADTVEAKRSPKTKPDQNRVKKDEGVWPEYLGGYHMIHRIDGEMFAVGVVDLTPQTLSSVYLFYNPKYEFLSPGTFCAVREIEYCLRIQETFKPDFKYYYMGLYFQDCQKSVYKANYKPSQLVCPVTYNYVYLTDQIKEMIRKQALPTLCLDKPKLKPMDLTAAQVQTLVSNFRFMFADNGKQLKIDELNPRFVKQVKDIITSLYTTLGLDLMLTCQFIV